MSMNGNVLEGRLTRRQVLAAGVAGATSFVVADCGSAAKHAAAWTFVDDRKQTVRLAKRPTRIVGFTTAAAALAQWGVTPVGVFGQDPRDDPALVGFPWGESEVVGSVYGEIDLGLLLELKAELIVSAWAPPFPLLFGFKDVAQQEQIGSQVPIVGLSGRPIATDQIDRYRELARALGADTTAVEIMRARAAFLRAAASLSKVSSRKSNLRIIAVSGDQNSMYVAKLVDFGDLSLYRRYGMPLISAETSDAYWDAFGWDHADKYPADGILYDARQLYLSLREAKEIPEFAALPAVRANQVAGWYVSPPPSYQAYAEAMGNLATAISGWRTVA